MAGASNNGGWPPDGGAPDDLPDLPDEWGVIVIPDDLSELADEVEAVRAELNTDVPATRWQRFARRPAVRRLRRAGTLLVRTPALIISMAVMVTVASLFASAWPGPPRQPTSQRTAGTTDTAGTTLPALEMIGADGQPVSLRSRLPAVIVLTDGCDCAGLIADTVELVKSGTTVLAVSMTAASVSPESRFPTARTPQAQGKTVSFLHDRTGSLRTHLDLGEPDGTAAVVLVDRLGDVVRTLKRTASADEFRPDLDRL